MTPERWKQIDQIFHSTLACAPGERAKFLAHACQSDDTLQREVEALLRADADTCSLLENLPVQVASSWARQPRLTEKIGQEIAHFRVIAPLGAGGMGEVYLAEDTKLKRKVALKWLRAEFTRDPERVERFKLEARAASALNHPNIVTIFEIDEIEGEYFIVTELVAGETLRQRITNEQLTLEQTLDIAIQLGSALAEAHAAGIIHRDIKPENVMVRSDNLVKILDFGLAKLSATTPLITTVQALTNPGIVMGTVAYMSPEQARGLDVDARSDLFSLGIVIYELLTGYLPFKGETATDTIFAIVNQEPLPLTEYAPDCPNELQGIISKTLGKDPAKRYQRAVDLVADLKLLRHELEFESEQDRRWRAASADARNNGQAHTIQIKPHPTDEQSANAGTASHQNALPIGWNHVSPKFTAIIAIVLLFVAAVATYLMSRSSTATPALTSKDVILLADWVNQTGEEVFDGTLKQGLKVQLQQSPFLSIFPDDRVQQTLRLMQRPTDTRITRAVGREIAERQGLKAVIVGSIAKFDRHYSITVEAINSQTDETIGAAQAEADNKDQVLKALSQTATDLRTKLGESLQSIQKFDAPLELTTSSLDALKAYSRGVEVAATGRYSEAIPFYKRATELDPNFAFAFWMIGTMYGNAGRQEQATEYSQKAFALKDRASEIERFLITSTYYSTVTGEIDKAIETLELHKRTYPQDWRAPTNLAMAYGLIGQPENVIAEAQIAIRLDPTKPPSYGNLGAALIAQNRFAEAREMLEKAIQQKLDVTNFHAALYRLAVVQSDQNAMQQQLDWARGKRDEYAALSWQAEAAAFSGQWNQAQDFYRRAIDLATHSNAQEIAAEYAVTQALQAAVLNQTTLARTAAQQALALDRSRVILRQAALALALSNHTARAQVMVNELRQRYPKDTLLNQLWEPTINAVIELQRGNAVQAIGLLQAPQRYEAAADFWPQYMRGQAYLKLQRAAEATAEFQKILKARGQSPLSILYPLAQLGLAQAAQQSGAQTQAHEAYEQFLPLWQGADRELRSAFMQKVY